MTSLPAPIAVRNRCLADSAGRGGCRRNRARHARRCAAGPAADLAEALSVDRRRSRRDLLRADPARRRADAVPRRRDPRVPGNTAGRRARAASRASRRRHDDHRAAFRRRAARTLSRTRAAGAGRGVAGHEALARAFHARERAAAAVARIARSGSPSRSISRRFATFSRTTSKACATSAFGCSRA